MKLQWQVTPELYGKVERSHRSDQQEFYQLLSYKDDIDLEAKLDEWEHFYNFYRPYGAFNGKHPMKRSEKDYNEQLTMSRKIVDLTTLILLNLLSGPCVLTSKIHVLGVGIDSP